MRGTRREDAPSPRAQVPALPEDARALLAEWLPPNDERERPVVTLATLDADGAPDARSVLLSEYDDEGLYVHTDSRSRKTAQMLADPRVAIVARWPELLRQLVVRGVAEPAPVEENARAYARRSPYLRQLAWQNTDDFARLPSAERLARWSAFDAERPADSLEPPDTWVGFRVRPTSLTFWYGSLETASRRWEVRLGDVGWERHDLAG